jgi:broad specificity phosphatase PhoE
MSPPITDPAVRPDLKALRRRPLFASLWVPLLGVAVLSAVVAGTWVLQRTTTVIVVRHAEKLVDGSKDPLLSPAGIERAARLAHQVRSAGVIAIYTTPYQRTRLTAERLAQASGAPVSEYDPKDTAGIAERVVDEHRGGTVIVVGHSNTVGRLVQALGGEAPDDIDESEYDHVWVVSVPTWGPSKTLHLHSL